MDRPISYHRHGTKAAAVARAARAYRDAREWARQARQEQRCDTTIRLADAAVVNAWYALEDARRTIEA